MPSRDSSDSAGLSPVPDDDEGSPEGTDPAHDADGTVTWQQATTTRKGQKHKKKKSEGTFVIVMAYFTHSTQVNSGKMFKNTSNLTVYSFHLGDFISRKAIVILSPHQY